jgi:polar amino acid transport system substrate-binding protein
MTRTASRLLALALIAAAVGGCAGTSDRAARTTLAALDTHASAPAPSPSSPSAQCKNVTASLRPPSPMPAPGTMPHGSFMARIKAHGNLVAGVDQNTLLLSYFSPSHARIEGFEIDLLHEVARAIFGDPRRVVFRAITTQERIQAVQSGSVDVVADAMTITCARRRQVDFSSVYYDAGQRVLVPTNSDVHRIQDLNGKRVCATIGSTSVQTIRRFAPRAIQVLVPQRTDCLVKLQQGRADAISTDDAILLGFKAQDPYTKLVGPRIAPEPYGMAIKQSHRDFVRFVNGVLARMRDDGTWKRLYTRWFGPYASTPAPPIPTYEG